jgi:hypothetical protein
VDNPIDFNRTKTLMPTPSLTMRPSDKPIVKPDSSIDAKPIP